MVIVIKATVRDDLLRPKALVIALVPCHVAMVVIVNIAKARPMTDRTGDVT